MSKVDRGGKGAAVRRGGVEEECARFPKFEWGDGDP